MWLSHISRIRHYLIFNPTPNSFPSMAARSLEAKTHVTWHLSRSIEMETQYAASTCWRPIAGVKPGL